jgi:hypothetical protein
MGDQPIGETTTYTTNMRQTTTGLETKIPAIKWLQIYALDCTAIGTGTSTIYFENNWAEEHVFPQVIFVFKNPFIHCSWSPVWYVGNSNWFYSATEISVQHH